MSKCFGKHLHHCLYLHEVQPASTAQISQIVLTRYPPRPPHISLFFPSSTPLRSPLHRLPKITIPLVRSFGRSQHPSPRYDRIRIFPYPSPKWIVLPSSPFSIHSPSLPSQAAPEHLRTHFLTGKPQDFSKDFLYSDWVQSPNGQQWFLVESEK